MATIKPDDEKKATPPYLPYKTFTNFIERLKASGVPARVDRSVLGVFSGAIQGQLVTALKYLSLINEHGTPTEKLEKLVAANENESRPIFKDILTSSYLFLFKEKVDLSKMTMLQLKQRFEDAGTSGDTTRKSLKFFLVAAQEAGIELSPYIKKAKLRVPRSFNAPKAKKSIVEKKVEATLTGSGRPQGDESNAQLQLLLSKFPSFDPEWSDEVKTKWFEGFSRLMDEFKK